MEAPLGRSRARSPSRRGWSPHAPTAARRARRRPACRGHQPETLEAVEQDLRSSGPSSTATCRISAKRASASSSRPSRASARPWFAGSEEPRPAGRRAGDLAQPSFGGLEVPGDDVGVAAVVEDRVERLSVAELAEDAPPPRRRSPPPRPRSPRASAAIARAISVIASGARSSSCSKIACASAASSSRGRWSPCRHACCAAARSARPRSRAIGPLAIAPGRRRASGDPRSGDRGSASRRAPRRRRTAARARSRRRSRAQASAARMLSCSSSSGSQFADQPSGDALVVLRSSQSRVPARVTVVQRVRARRPRSSCSRA